jgi:catechol 2,3-dioxygenase-like lactoylglutathione lyase family enzyme
MSIWPSCHHGPIAAHGWSAAATRGGLRMLGDHVVFPIVLSTDLAKSRAFYHETLGLEIAREDHERIMFRCGGGSLLAVSLSTTGTADTQTQLAWRVADLRAELADLRARGVPIQEYDSPDPKTVDGIADMGFAWSAWIVDPSRNVLAIIEPKAPVGRAG